MRTRLAVAALLTILAAPSWAQDPNYSTQRTSAPLPPTVSFRNQPAWVKVPGSTVSILQQDQRPTYDMFAFDNQYYIYNEGYNDLLEAGRVSWIMLVRNLILVALFCSLTLELATRARAAPAADSTRNDGRPVPP